MAANGKRSVAECYALGLDPADATNDFRIVSIELVDGKPKVEWEPKTNRWTGAEIKATLKGAAELKERIDSRLGREILPYAESLGLGSRKYELVEV